MSDALTAQQQAQQAVFSPDLSVPLTFGNDGAARQAAEAGVAVCDRSHWGRIRVGDRDRLRFLHNQTTNQIQQLQPGQGCETVFVTSTGRTLDLATALITEDAVLLLVSPGQAQPRIEWMDRYIFFADKVSLRDETAETAALTLLGPQTFDWLATLGAPHLATAAAGSHETLAIADIPCRVVVGSGLVTPGVTILLPRTEAAMLWAALVNHGAVPLGDRVWEQLRIEQGRPMPGAELTEDYNPLEAGLWHTISFSKGCYIGQETIARLNTYQGVKQQLWGLRLSAPAEAGEPLMLDGDKVGRLTSVVETPNGLRGLGYVRTKAGGAGLSVSVGDAIATVLPIPFASRGYLELGQ